MTGDSDSTALERAVEQGTELASKLAGASMGLLGPAGVLAGPPVEWISRELLTRVGETVMALVGRRGAERAGAALVIIKSDADARRDAGEAPRDDGFDQPQDDQRPDADELLEGVLLHAAETYEERKVPLLAHLYDGLAFDPSVSAQEGHFLLKLADRLTYRQLVGLSVFSDEASADALAEASIRREEGVSRPSDAVALEVDDLAESGVLGIEVGGTGEVTRPGELIGGQGRPSSQSFQDLKPTAIGATLSRLMRLGDVPAEDKQQFLRQLATPVRH